MSQKEADEYKLIEDNISFDHNVEKWRVKYPWLQDPSVLKNNYYRCLKIAESTERKLLKD